MIGLVVFAAGSFIALFSTSFEMLLVARMVQGMGAAATRILSVTIVRDRFEGREMARVMSLTMMVFIIVPIFAPSVGSLILLFGSLARHLRVDAGAGAGAGGLVRQAHAGDAASGIPDAVLVERIAAGARRCLSQRTTVGYSTAMGLMFGALMAYLGSTQQIFETEVYGLGAIFPVVFGSIAAVMGVASFINAEAGAPARHAAPAACRHRRLSVCSIALVGLRRLPSTASRR